MYLSEVSLNHQQKNTTNQMFCKSSISDKVQVGVLYVKTNH